MSVYTKAKQLFEDNLDNDYFVLLTRTKVAYSRLENSLKNPFKIVLLYGKPGTGKSRLLRRFYLDHKDKLNIFFYPSPTFDSIRSIMEIYIALCSKQSSHINEKDVIDMFKEIPNKKLEASDLQDIIAAFKAKTSDPIFILLDEAQLYDNESLEWIRILSNEGVFRFIVVVHKVFEEDLLAKEHFQTRTFETIEISPIDLNEISRFVETKLLLADLGEIYDKFTPANYDRIYQLTKGNLRGINRLLNRFFELLEVMQEHKPHKIPSKFSNKFIEMSAMELNILNG